jgi:hypothetical protein
LVAVGLPNGAVEMLAAYDKGLAAKAVDYRRKCALPDYRVPEGLEGMADPDIPPCSRAELDGGAIIRRSARLLAYFQPPEGGDLRAPIRTARRKLTADLLELAAATVDRGPPREIEPRRDNAGAVIGPPTDRRDQSYMARALAALWLSVRSDGADRQTFARAATALAYPGTVLADFRQYPPDPIEGTTGSRRALLVDAQLDRAAEALGFADLLPGPQTEAAADKAVEGLIGIEFKTEAFSDAGWARLVTHAAAEWLKARGQCGESSFCAQLSAAEWDVAQQANQQHFP